MTTNVEVVARPGSGLEAVVRVVDTMGDGSQTHQEFVVKPYEKWTGYVTDTRSVKVIERKIVTVASTLPPTS